MTLAASNLPTGVSAAFSQPTLTGTTLTSTLTLSAPANATATTGSVTVTASSSGVTSATAAVGVMLTASGGGTGNVNLRFCDVASLPTFVAFRSGTTGSFTRATLGTNNTYSFTINGVGAMVWVTLDQQNSPTVSLWYGSVSELNFTGTNQCSSAATRKSHTGTFLGLGLTQTGSVAMGGSFAQGIPGSSSFSISNVLDGNTDLLAFRGMLNFMTGASTPDRGVLRRNVNYANGAVIPAIDFAGPESFAPATATVTVANAQGATVAVSANVLTANGTSLGGFNFGSLAGGGSNVVYGLPATLTQSSDLHLVSASANTFTGFTVIEQRSVSQVNRLLADRTLTLGPSLDFPQLVTVSTTPYARVRAFGNWQSDYGDQIFAFFSQQSGGVARGLSVFATRAYFSNAATYDFEVPDFSGVSGWNNSWGLVGGSPTQVGAFAQSGSGGATQSEGVVSRSAARFGIYTP